MKVKTVVESLESSKEFQAWRAKDKDSFLVHLFMIVDKENIKWHVGYCNKKDKITTFDIAEKIHVHAPEKAFKKPGSKIQKLDLAAVKLDIADVLERIHRLQQEKYSAELPVRKIVILQHIDEGQVYNVTYVTAGLKTLTVKLDAASGEIKAEQLQSMFTFTGKDITKQ
ncbi:MAG: hypothetical protein Q7R76_03640 [Candidatus Woesearchaeota archaeon]|nr:hypothetical protein [Candidatus Woesearchaeota archaeon]